MLAGVKQPISATMPPAASAQTRILPEPPIALMNVNRPEFNTSASIGLYPKILAIVLLVAEVLLISARFDAETVQTSGAMPLQNLLSHAALLIQWLSVAGGAYLIIRIAGEAAALQPINQPLPGPSLPWLLLNLACYGVFFWLTSLLFNSAPNAIVSSWLLAGSWLATGLAVLLSLLRLAMPCKAYLALLQQQRTPLLISLAIATVVTATSLLSKNLWPAVIYPTFASAETLLSLFVGDVISIPENLYLGIDQFVVEVSSTCSGIEGMGLAVSFTLLYLFMIRSQLRFPRAFLLVPLAAIISWLLNVLRITLLILLGEFVSADFAVGGFHSQAGWFTFIALALLIIVCFNRITWFKKEPTFTPQATAEATAIKDPQGSAILSCFLLFLAGALVAGLNENALNWLYPIKAIAGGAALMYFWRLLDIPKPDQWLAGVGLGLVALVLWVLLIPGNAEFDQTLAASLASSSLPLSLLWLLIRFIGSIAVAPIIEELVFRSYLLARVSNFAIDHHRPVPFHLLGLVCSALAFGAIHNQWLAGFVVGVVYALARYRGNLGTAILAHATTNACLCVYALVAGQWSYL